MLFFRGKKKTILLLCLGRQRLRRVVVGVSEIKLRKKALTQQEWGRLPQLCLRTNKINQHFVKRVRHIRNLLTKVLEPCVLSFSKEHSFSLLRLFSSHPSWVSRTKIIIPGEKLVCGKMKCLHHWSPYFWVYFLHDFGSSLGRVCTCKWLRFLDYITRQKIYTFF